MLILKMFGFLMKPKFNAKCNSAIKMTKKRLEIIKRKRNAVEKYLKNDIAELLNKGLDYNAYGRAEGLLIEQKRTVCYNFIEQFSECISKHVSDMQKQSECPEECKEAIPSLIYAAARFADLPELRDLRIIFTQRYENSLEPYLNQEFVQKLKAEPPTQEMKLQLMHDIAQEFSIEWDSKALEQKLFKPFPSDQKEARHKSLDDAGDDGYKSCRSKHDTFQTSNNHDDDENGLSNMHEFRSPKRNETGLTSCGKKEDTDENYKLQSGNESEVTDQDIPKISSTSVESVSEDGVENRKPFFYRFISNVIRPSLGEGKSSTEKPTTPSDNTDSAGESKPKPRSVRRRPLKPPPGREGLSSFGNGEAASISPTAVNHKEARKGLASIQMEENDQKDDEEKSPYERVSNWKANLPPPPGRQTAEDIKANLPPPPGRQTAEDTKANLPPPPGRQAAEDTKEGSSSRSAKSDPSSPPGRAATSPIETAGMHNRASSFQSDMFAGHVHPKLPDYDDLATRLAALRRE